MRRAAAWVQSYVLEQDPRFWVAFTPALVVAAILFVRSPASNYIFDEQEALLANPYVNNDTLGFWASFPEAFRVDFWGLPPTRSIGSYRPLPNLIWRGLWQVSTLPWLHHWVNVVVHAANAALVASFAFVLSRRRAVGWLAGATFVTSAVLTEAVSGVVGIADVLGGLGVLLALHALRLPLLLMPWGVAAACLIGLFSKESCLVAVPLLPWVALVAAPSLHPPRPWRLLRPVLALLGAAAALVLYTEIRRRMFPVQLPSELSEPLPGDPSWVARGFHAFLRWFAQPRLPADPINNPLINADLPHRIAGALRVYFRGLVQVIAPFRLSGDYSYRQEPVPESVVFPESVLGGLLLVVPPLVGIVLAGRLLWLRDRAEWLQYHRWASGLRRLWQQIERRRANPDAEEQPAQVECERQVARTELGEAPRPPEHSAVAGRIESGEWALVGEAPRPSEQAAVAGGGESGGWVQVGEPPNPRQWAVVTATALLAIGLVWIPVAYFPHSNIPIELPTVRAERFWYLPVIGWALLAPVGALALVERLRWHRVGLSLVLTFFVFQALGARLHALDYTDDLIFWRSARQNSPYSAKAHLNYSVMVGARGRLEERLTANTRALELAPQWPMAHVYEGDTLCRLNRVDEAWPHYVSGWKLAPNDSNLIALSLQCMWDHGAIKARSDELLNLAYADEYRGTWLAYLVAEVVNHGEEHGGVPEKYRPRGYDQGPKEE